MLGATNFLGDFVKDEMKCRVLSVEDFGAPIDNEKNDVPYHNYSTYHRKIMKTAHFSLRPRFYYQLEIVRVCKNC